MDADIQGLEGVDASWCLGDQTVSRAKSVTGKLSSGMAGRRARWRASDDEPVQEAE